jgi:hypothetical protein
MEGQASRRRRWARALLRGGAGVVLLLAAPWPAAGEAPQGPPVEPSPPDLVAPKGPEASPLNAPALYVAGTIVTSQHRLGFVVPLDDRGRELGILRVSEGDLVQGYRVAEIGTSGVSFERGAQRVLVRLGRPPDPGGPPEGPAGSGPGTPARSPEAGARRREVVPVVPFASDNDRPEALTEPPADNAEELREEAKRRIEPLLNHPAFRAQIEKVRQRLIQEQLRGNAGGPAATRPAPSPGGADASASPVAPPQIPFRIAPAGQ